jgi:hypothetical protein
MPDDPLLPKLLGKDIRGRLGATLSRYVRSDDGRMPRIRAHRHSISVAIVGATTAGSAGVLFTTVATDNEHVASSKRRSRATCRFGAASRLPVSWIGGR